MLTGQIRTHFLDYFRQQQHIIVPSAPLIPQGDPTLLFVNAGMVPFKNFFTGLELSPAPRAASAQKCLRAGGKHNDLENVGYTSRHHTFFEMLGNFSFGDYFKEEAIFYAWHFITHELGLSPDRLCVTVYAEDQEAATLWKKIAALPSHKIIPIATADNFWSMGDVGPCGPCTEIFYDHGEHIAGGPPGTPEAEGDRFVEIWNLVFMQSEQLPSGERILLPKPSIDTGMGLERIAAVMQGVQDNYETDIFRALIGQATQLTHTPLQPTNQASFKVIADHVRAGAFLVADGILPSNEGRGYVLRRILRRAMRHAYFLGSRDPLLVHLIPTLIQQMGEAYPELGRAQAFIETTFDLEERRFQQTLEKGLTLLTQETASLPSNAPLPGATAFKLYDTFGFPLDLTQDILREQGRCVDEVVFQTLMADQKALARAAWAGSGEQAVDGPFFDLKERFGETAFLGYTQEETRAVIQALLVNGQEVTKLEPGQTGFLIVDQTPFYAESGGQVGDTGSVQTTERAVGVITDTQKRAGLFVHTIEMSKGSLERGQEVLLVVDSARRHALRGHHSATHLLHQALRQILGPHVTQRGSLVTPEKLRFDFSHPSRLSATELTTLEQLVNKEIRRNHPVVTRLMIPNDAIKTGALALFGEKYGDEVRVVSMGSPLSQEVTFSTELCGGTHVTRTGELGFFKITSESGVASGVRRIEAVVGYAAELYVEQMLRITRGAADTLKVAIPQLSEKLERLLAEKRSLAHELQTIGQNTVSSPTKRETLSPGLFFLFQETKSLSIQAMKGLMDALKQEINRGIVMVGQVDQGRSTLLIGVKEVEFDARVLLQTLLIPWGGKGGGRVDLAQGGWIGGPSLESAAQKLIEHLRSLPKRSESL